jgi:protease-4
VKTGQFADTFTISRPKSPAEMAMIQRAVDWIYGEFVGKVAEARKLDPRFVEEIAQGRVWSGTEAKVLGLLDELGGLQDALNYAAAKAKLGENYRVVEFPRKKELAEVITELLNGFQQVRTGSSVAGQVLDRIETELNSLRTFNDPQGIYARMPLELNLQ